MFAHAWVIGSSARVAPHTAQTPASQGRTAAPQLQVELHSKRPVKQGFLCQVAFKANGLWNSCARSHSRLKVSWEYLCQPTHSASQLATGSYLLCLLIVPHIVGLQQLFCSRAREFTSLVAEASLHKLGRRSSHKFVCRSFVVEGCLGKLCAGKS